MDELQQILAEIKILSEKVDKLNTSVIGNKEYGHKGIIERIEKIEIRQESHDTDIKKAKTYITVVGGITSALAFIAAYLRNLWN